jgi:hypothetical protein
VSGSYIAWLMAWAYSSAIVSKNPHPRSTNLACSLSHSKTRSPFNPSITLSADRLTSVFANIFPSKQ